MPARSGHPCDDWRIASAQDHPDVVGKRGNKHLAKPRVEQAEDFVGIERENYAASERAPSARSPSTDDGGSAALARARSRVILALIPTKSSACSNVASPGVYSRASRTKSG